MSTPGPTVPTPRPRPRHTLRNVLLGLVALALVLALAAGFVIWRVLHPGPAESVSFVKGTGPGSVVSAESLPDLPVLLRVAGTKAARVLYHSTGPDGAETTVSGSVFLPRGTAPKGGWPVIALAHGTTGIQESCAPSLSDDLLGLAPVVLGYTRAGFAVALPDYQGLGAPGAHPYLDNPVEGENVIDAVRALRRVWPQVSERWLAFGTSQGGGAAWSANELASTYGKGLDLVGSVSLSPASDVTGMVAKAQAGTLTRDQLPALQAILESLHRVDPTFDLDLYRTGASAADWDALSQCAPDKLAARGAAAAAMGALDLAPQTPEAAADLTQRLQAMAVAQRPLSAPMLVVYGALDTYVDAAWTTAALARQEQLGGGPIDADLQQDKGHGDVDGTAAQAWITDRFRDPPGD